jgi:hypothetical protein
MRLVALLELITLAALPGAAIQAQPKGLEWQCGPGTIALLQGGRTVWQFNYGARLSKTYFHPVALPGGSDVTWLSPEDHPHHFALFFSWKYLNHVNYWEEPEGVPEGKTRWTNVRVETRRDYSAKIALDLQYRPNHGVADVLTERRAIAVSRPERDGAYFMDWDMEFTAEDEDVVLDRTPPDTAPDGNARGGYAGLSVRLTREWTNPTVAATAPLGTLARDRYGFAAAAAEFSGVIDGAEAGIAFFDHPSNPRHPTRWYGILDGSVPFWYLNASLLQLESYTLRARQSLRLRYRVFVHPERWDSSRLLKEHSIYCRAR